MKVLFKLLWYMLDLYLKHPLWWIGGWMLPQEISKIDKAIEEFIEHER